MSLEHETNVKATEFKAELFDRLLGLGCIGISDVCSCDDGFCAIKKSVSEILAVKDVLTFPGDESELECRLFFDDWYLYAVPSNEGFVYSLFKMREQEHDIEMGLKADGDTPGVTVCFIEMDTQILMRCLINPVYENRKLLGKEINRVAAYRKQKHNRVLKDYFISSKSSGAYLMAELYISFIASLSQNGCIAVPERYLLDYKKNKNGRVYRFIEKNNKDAGYTVCDHKNVYIKNPDKCTEHEQMALLCAFTGNTSLYSFAAEVQFHARFLTWWAKIPIPIIGRSAYASAIRADMSIGDSEFAGPTPYYRSNSNLVKKQRKYHKNKT